MREDALTPIGKVVGTHGIKGYLKVLSFAESTASFAPGKQVALRQKGKPLVAFRIESARPHKRGLLLALEGIASVDMAKKWVGYELCIDKTTLPELEKGTYYWHQIIGLEVLTVDDRRLGRVAAIVPTGSNDVYVVRDEKDERKEVLVPAIDSVVVDIDLKQEVLRVDLPEGLED
ncbi:MAG: 16S rRNA processing protein RimM [Deltaproteobacteria bacterium]|nr:16S rRNA processing protein RimM [Deltaproteobacteria bacterium]MBW2018968.1 16S rRNA processing protein RimM [Deltaproteobacteria bacterium]MBW2073558.1 16S rRNA processing protein RimM [Deltaproteobacteria bacterium]RLB82728.1 MAG: 16S rRNA processing protein RimM [Deltaproteobacteria bacterium]